MNILLLIFLQISTVTSVTVGPEVRPKQLKELEAVVKPEVPLTKRIYLLVDSSGSMIGEPLDKAVGAAFTLIESAVDDFELAILTFNSSTQRWKGFPAAENAKPIAEGWGRFPDGKAATAAKKWLCSLKGTANTDPIPALKIAFNDKQDVSIVLITDGWFDHNPLVLSVIQSEQIKRENDERGKAIIMTYCTGEPTGILYSIATEGRGGLYVEKRD